MLVELKKKFFVVLFSSFSSRKSAEADALSHFSQVWDEKYRYKNGNNMGSLLTCTELTGKSGEKREETEQDIPS